MVALFSVGHSVADIGRSLREAFYMFWDTLWALVLGFGLAGAVQAFVSRDQMQRRLGDHRPAAVARASVYGMVSSSCSYAASALARSLFVGGADFLTAMVFLFASTNLVIELGLVLLVLMGWQFVAAEFVGGIIMIALLVVLGARWFRGRALDEARRMGQESRQQDDHHRAEGEPGAEQSPRLPWPRRVRSVAGWADAASYTVSDLTMLRRELIVGFVAAGFLTELVPVHVWNDLFLHGHGFATTLENVIIGPLVAMASFVCSIGNVPLAAALWTGGISFGGVISFIFADLITLPLLVVYRKQYGDRMTLRILGLFWLVMSAAGLVTQALFGAVGWIPTNRATVIASEGVSWDYTTVLNLVALVALAVLFWLSHHRLRFGGGQGYAQDPVCGMQVEMAHAPASATHLGRRHYFCCGGCRDRFVADPDRYRGEGKDTPAADTVAVTLTAKPTGP